MTERAVCVFPHERGWRRMGPVPQWWKRLRERIRIDTFLLLILLTVGIAALLPARGAVATGVGHATTVAIGLLFFLYGARLSTREAIEGLRHWRLHGTV